MKIKKCICGTKPTLMRAGTFSGYVMCGFCGKQTKVFDNDVYILGQSWEQKATKAWNSGSVFDRR